MSEPVVDLHWGTVADWVVAFGTLAVAAAAVFQDWLRSFIFAPELRVSLRNSPPDCVWVPFAAGRAFISDTIHVRLFVENVGYRTARDVEVYAWELRRFDPGGWRKVETFPPMNLVWADVGGTTVTGMATDTG